MTWVDPATEAKLMDLKVRMKVEMLVDKLNEEEEGGEGDNS